MKMTNLEKAQRIVALNNESERLKKNIEFIRDGRFQDEFILAYAQTLNEHADNIKLTHADVECLRRDWKDRKIDADYKLNELLDG